MTAPFWMICRAPQFPHSKTEPTRRYDTEAEARKDAQAMADQTGADFVILTATHTIRPQGSQRSLF
ncbi:hypothetical protein [Pseudotabrizicola algicola]|uniref:DUF2188 domain-containing protein n=1 Tax=Pseudotabrizicola algicola TaxID=2709381 RepID=A0A6B3RQ74_9RHOB|nr:hypothetical protein [Pseudotabrizicola algicola]NEX45212.1 hypothetical protein [Pseudotabrizicola algicola]